jgi:hypothetical protein
MDNPSHKELDMKILKTVAVCAMVALGISAASATAASLITSANIKDGSILNRDIHRGTISENRLTQGLRAKINRLAQPGKNGINGAPGAPGAKGQDGANREEEEMRYDRMVGSCVTNGKPGTVSIAHGMARLGAPEDMAWAQIRSYPVGLTLADVTDLMFRSNASDPGVVYLKITTEGNHSILYSPNTQAGGEQGLGSWFTHDVLAGSVRLDDDAGANPDMTWNQVLAQVGDKQIKDVRVTAGCANPVGTDGALVRLADVTINDEVVSFG